MASPHSDSNDRDLSVLVDPTTGRPILMAQRRRHRPHLTAEDAGADACPFCPGHEDRTPPEVDAARVPGSAPDTPGWRVRAFDNLYPASPWHEVIAEGAVHAEQPAALDVDVWRDAIALYRRRVLAIEALEGVRHAFLFKNVGRRAGASIAHNHSQIIGLPVLPPRLGLELAHGRDRPCVLCEEAATAEAEGRAVCAGRHHVAFSPRNPKFPYETWLAPLDHHAADLGAAHSEDLARTLHALFVAFDTALTAPPFNLFLHRVPGEDFHWHYELQPRNGNMAGLEVGGDMYINVVPAIEAAARLRSG